MTAPYNTSRFERRQTLPGVWERSRAPFMLPRLARALVWIWDLIVAPLEDR